MSNRIESKRWQGPVWKLTTASGTTNGSCQWGRRVANPHGIRSGEYGLCSSSWYHGYDNAYLAVLLNPIHANITVPKLWVAEWRGQRLDDKGLKFGATEFRTIQVVDAPVVTREQQVAFAILCAAQVWDETTGPAWQEWAAKWLAGEDRSAKAATAATAATYAAAATAATNAANAATNAATAATYAATAAYYAAKAANDAAAAYAVNAAPEDVLENAIAWALALEPGEPNG